MKRIVLFSFWLLAFAQLFGQSSKLPNTLLWRISGNGLTRPSYLYGTMHLTDKRVFQLGDSLYKGIEQSEGFAGELDMNGLGMQMVNYIIADKEANKAREAVKVKDAVSAATWERYKGQLAEKFYKSADKITVDDLEELGSSLEGDMLKKGDMPTFLDAYLFGMARKEGKWVGGLEDLNDQIEHINSENIEHKIQKALFDDEYYRSGLERMIKIYTSQLLDSIDVVMYREENGQKDYIMIKRNLKMARMMDSLSSVRSSFFAVGAAHLPGDSGVIALLQSRGFTLTPVFSSKKISADKYVIKGKEIPWVPVNVKDNIYGLAMPGVSENVDILESMGLNMKVYFDISFMKLYMTLGVEISEDRKKLGADSLYRAMRSRFFDQAKDLKEKNVTVNGVEGREFSGNTDDGILRIQIFLPAMEEVVMNMVLTLNKKTLMDDEADKFFSSFTYNGIKKTSAPEETVWTNYSYPNQLFSIDWPAKPRETKDVKSYEGKIIYAYQALDLKNQLFYGMNVTSVKEGLYQAHLDSNYFNSVKEGLRARMTDAKILDSGFVKINGYPGYRVRVIGKAQGEQFETIVTSVLRGNRNYYLYVVYAPMEANRVVADRFLGSFKLLPASASNWKMVTSPDTAFSIYTNVALKKMIPDEDDLHRDAKRFIIYDSIISSSSFIDKTTLPDWLWYSSDTAFLRKRAKQYKKYSDSIADYKVVVIGSQTIADFRVLAPGVRLMKRVKMVLNGNELYEVFGHFDSLDYEAQYRRIFDDFHVLKEATPIDRSHSDVNKLAKVLKDGGLEELKQVKLWWGDLSFSKDDLPVLQTLILKLYPDFDSGYVTGFNWELLQQVKKIDSLNTTVDYIKKNYGRITASDEPVTPYIIYYLAGVHTPESYGVLKSILLSHPPKGRQSAYPLYRLFDSLELSASLFPEILRLSDSEASGVVIQELTVKLLDSGLITKKMIIENSRGFINFAKRELDNHKEIIEQASYEYSPCIKILGIINNAESNALLNRFAKLSNRAIRFRTLIAQLTNNQPVDSRTIYTMATTDEYRLDLYLELKKMGKLKLFPVSFLSQHDLGKSKLYNYSSTETQPATINFVVEKIIDYKGKKQKFLLYKVEPGDYESGPYLGVSGPYSLNDKDYVSSDEATGVYREKKFDSKDLDKLFKDYLASLDEEKDDEDIPPPPLAPMIIRK